MADAKTLKIILSAQDKAGPTLNKLQSQTNSFGASIMKHNRAIGAGMTAMGAAILGSAVMSVKSYSEMGDQVQKLALKTGFSTEALSEWRHASELSGASLETLDKGVKRMSKTIVDATEGMATYIRSFDRIGLSAEDLLRLSPEDQFDKIALAISGMENQAMKAATAQDIFGRAGTELLPMLEQGADGIEAMRKEAHELGIVFDQEAADAAAKMKDDMTRMTRSLDGVKLTIAEALLPTVIALVEKITSVITSVKDWMKENPALASTITKVAVGVGALAAVMGPLLIFLPSLVSGLSMVRVAALKASVGFKTMTLSVTAANVAMKAGLVGAVLGLGVALSQMFKKSATAADKINELASELAGLNSRSSETQTAINSIAERIKSLAEDATPQAIAEIIELRKELATLTDQQEKDKKVITERNAALNAELRAAQYWYKSYREKIELLKENKNASVAFNQEEWNSRDALEAVTQAILSEYIPAQGAAIGAVWDYYDANIKGTAATRDLEAEQTALTDSLKYTEIAMGQAEAGLGTYEAAVEAAQSIVNGLSQDLDNAQSKLDLFMNPRLKGMQESEDAIAKLQHEIASLDLANRGLEDLDTSMGGTEALQNNQLNQSRRRQRDENAALIEQKKELLELAKLQATVDFDYAAYNIKEAAEEAAGLNKEFSFDQWMTSLDFLTTIAIPSLTTQLVEAQDALDMEQTALETQQAIVTAFEGILEAGKTNLELLNEQLEGTADSAVEQAERIAAAWSEAYEIAGVSNHQPLSAPGSYQTWPGYSSGGGGRSITVILEQDGEVTARAVAPYLVDEIRLKTGMKD